MNLSLFFAHFVCVLFTLGGPFLSVVIIALEVWYIIITFPRLTLPLCVLVGATVYISTYVANFFLYGPAPSFCRHPNR